MSKSCVVKIFGWQFIVHSFAWNSIFCLSQKGDIPFEFDFELGTLFKLNLNDGVITTRIAVDSVDELLKIHTPSIQKSYQKQFDLAGNEYFVENSGDSNQWTDEANQIRQIRKAIYPSDSRSSLSEITSAVITTLCDASLDAKMVRQRLSKISDKVNWNSIVVCRLHGSTPGYQFNFDGECSTLQELLNSL